MLAQRMQRPIVASQNDKMSAALIRSNVSGATLLTVDVAVASKLQNSWLLATMKCGSQAAASAVWPQKYATIAEKFIIATGMFNI